MDIKVYWSILAWANLGVLVTITEFFIYDKQYGSVFCLTVLIGHIIYFLIRGIDVLHDLSVGRRK
jgi:hypothetical protein